MDIYYILFDIRSIIDKNRMNQSNPQRKSSVLEKANMLQNLQLPSAHGVANKAQASNAQSQKKKDEFKSQIAKMLENRGVANVPDNTYEDSGDEEEVSSIDDEV